MHTTKQPQATTAKRTCDGPPCWDIQPSTNNACGWSAEADGAKDAARFGRVAGDIADRQFKIYNMHPTKELLVTVKVTVETQLPEAATQGYLPLPLEAVPKGSISGGRPDGIDKGGPDRFLGCECDGNSRSHTGELAKRCT